MGKLQFTATGLRHYRRDGREQEDYARRMTAASILVALFILLAAIVRGIVATPSALVFPDTLVNAPSQPLTLALTGLSGSTMRFPLSGPDAENFEVGGCAVAENTACSLLVTFRPRKEGRHTATLKILDDRQTQLGEVAFSGAGVTEPPPVTDVVATPNPLIFPDTSVDRRSQLPLSLTLTGLSGSKMSLNLSGSGAESFEIDDGCRVARATTNCSVSVTFHPLKKGPHAATLSILDDTKAQLEKVVLRGSASEAPLAANILPNPAPMSPQEVGISNGGYPIRITNTGGVSFDIGYQAPPSAFQVRGVCTSKRLSPNDSCTELIDFMPSAKGSFSQQIGVLLNGAHRYTLVVSGTGTQAQVDIVPALSFMAGRETKSVAVTNVGDAPLRISSAVMSGDQGQFSADAGSCIAAHVPAGQSCQIRVAVITDTRTTAQQAVLRMTDNAPGSPRSISVRADAFFANVVAYPSSHDFGNVIVGVSSDLSITFKNMGNAPTGQLRISTGGGFAVVDSGCQQLNQGDSCAMTIRFTPASPQSYTNTVTLRSQIGVWSVLLRGTGVPRPPQIGSITG